MATNDGEQTTQKMVQQRDTGRDLIFRLESKEARFELKALAAKQQMSVQKLLMAALNEYIKSHNLRG
jgi:hypothetical protein